MTEMVYREDQGYRFNPFPWHRLRTTLAQKARAQGIRFAPASADDEKPKD